MATPAEILPLKGPPAAPPAVQTPRTVATYSDDVLASWTATQSLNLTRHAADLQPFKREEFGTGPEAPSEAHIQAVNSLISMLRRGLLQMSRGVSNAAKAAIAE